MAGDCQIECVVLDENVQARQNRDLEPRAGRWPTAPAASTCTQRQWRGPGIRTGELADGAGIAESVVVHRPQRILQTNHGGVDVLDVVARGAPGSVESRSSSSATWASSPVTRFSRRVNNERSYEQGLHARNASQQAIDSCRTRSAASTTLLPAGSASRSPSYRIEQVEQLGGSRCRPGRGSPNDRDDAAHRKPKFRGGRSRAPEGQPAKACSTACTSRSAAASACASVERFDHHPHQRFGAARAHQHSASFTELGLDGCDLRFDRPSRVRFDAADGHVAQHLRNRRHRRAGERREGPAVARQHVEHLQPRQQPVAGRRQLREDDVARLLPAE